MEPIPTVGRTLVLTASWWFGAWGLIVERDRWPFRGELCCYVAWRRTRVTSLGMGSRASKAFPCLGWLGGFGEGNPGLKDNLDSIAVDRSNSCLRGHPLGGNDDDLPAQLQGQCAQVV